MATAAAAEACSAARLHGAAREARAARHQPRSRLPCALCAARASDVRGLQHRAVQRGSWMAAMDRWLRRPLPKRARLLGCTAQHVRPARPASSLDPRTLRRELRNDCDPHPVRGAIRTCIYTLIMRICGGWSFYIEIVIDMLATAFLTTLQMQPRLRLVIPPVHGPARPGPARQRRHGHPIQ